MRFLNKLVMLHIMHLCKTVKQPKTKLKSGKWQLKVLWWSICICIRMANMVIYNRYECMVIYNRRIWWSIIDERRDSTIQCAEGNTQQTPLPWSLLTLLILHYSWNLFLQLCLIIYCDTRQHKVRRGRTMRRCLCSLPQTTKQTYDVKYHNTTLI